MRSGSCDTQVTIHLRQHEHTAVVCYVQKWHPSNVTFFWQKLCTYIQHHGMLYQMTGQQTEAHNKLVSKKVVIGEYTVLICALILRAAVTLLSRFLCQ